MPHGNRAAVYIYTALVNVEGLHEAQNHRGEGLIDFKEINVGNGHPAVFQNLFCDRNRSGEHDRWIGSNFRRCTNNRAGFEPAGGSEFFRANQDASRPIYNARRVAGMVDMVDPLQMRIFHQCEFIKAGHGFAQVFEGRFQGPQ